MALDAPTRAALLGVFLFGGALGFFTSSAQGSAAGASRARSQDRAAIVALDPRTPLNRAPRATRAESGFRGRPGATRKEVRPSQSRKAGGLGEITLRGGVAPESDADRSQDEEASQAESAGSDLRRPVSPQHQALLAKVQRVLNFYQRKLLDTRDNNCWELMHSIVAYGVNSQVRRGGPRGQAVNSIAWLCSGAACNGTPLIYLDEGRVTAAKGPRVQGHYGQFLAILAQSRVMVDYQILVGGREFTVADLIETEKLDCRSGMELTFKLIAFAHYLDSDETWNNAQGEEWSIPRLIQEEIESPINGAACGGTHRLMGLSYAVRERQSQMRPVDGEFLRAQKYLNDFHRYTFRLQNRDGSFSTEWFKRRAAKEDLERRLQTSGHILEWLTYSVPDETLDDPQYVKAVAYLAGILDAGRDRQWSVGPLGHGLHALALYEERMSGGEEAPSAAASVARRNSHRRIAPFKSLAAPARRQIEPRKETEPLEDVESRKDVESLNDVERGEAESGEGESREMDAEPETGPEIIQPVLVPAAAPRRGAEERSDASDDADPTLESSLRD